MNTHKMTMGQWLLLTAAGAGVIAVPATLIAPTALAAPSVSVSGIHQQVDKPMQVPNLPKLKEKPTSPKFDPNKPVPLKPKVPQNPDLTKPVKPKPKVKPPVKPLPIKPLPKKPAPKPKSPMQQFFDNMGSSELGKMF